MAKANLIELVKRIEEGSLAPAYELRNSKSFKEKQDNPILEIYGFDDDTAASKVYEIFWKQVSLKAFNNSLKELDITDWKAKNVEELREEFLKNEDALRGLNFKNYHAFWTKDYWNIKNSGFLLDMYTVLGGTFFSNGRIISGSIVTAVGQIPNEVVRRLKIKSFKKENNTIQKKIDAYDTFVDNLNKAEIKVIDIPEAREIIKGVRSVEKTSPYVDLRYKKINRDLTDVYIKKGLVLS